MPRMHAVDPLSDSPAQFCHKREVAAPSTLTAKTIGAYPMQTVAQRAEYQGDAVTLRGSSLRALFASVPRISRRRWLRISAGAASITVAYAFSRIASGRDYRMQIFLFVVVSIGVFMALWGITEQRRRGR